MAPLVEFGYDLPVLYKNDANRKSLAATDEVYDESYADCQVKRRSRACLEPVGVSATFRRQVTSRACVRR